MIYSYTQLSQYLACPRKYRYRYVDGWQEKETRAGLLFGRAFEQALAAYFQCQDATEVLFKEWSQYQNTTLDYTHGDSWDRMLQQGIKLLELFCQEDRVEIRHPKRNLQIKISRPLSPISQFVGYVDALGYLDGTRCVIDWKTTAARYPDQPDGLLALPVLAQHHHRRAAARVRAVSRRQYQPDRGGTVSGSSRHPLPAKRLYQLPVPGAVLKESAAD